MYVSSNSAIIIPNANTVEIDVISVAGSTTIQAHQYGAGLGGASNVVEISSRTVAGNWVIAVTPDKPVFFRLVFQDNGNNQEFNYKVIAGTDHDDDNTGTLAIYGLGRDAGEIKPNTFTVVPNSSSLTIFILGIAANNPIMYAYQ